jgi:hypothetical protein
LSGRRVSEGITTLQYQQLTHQKAAAINRV